MWILIQFAAYQQGCHTDKCKYLFHFHEEEAHYTITYVDAADHSNPLTYNIEDDTIVLVNPVWSGLSFAYWTNENGISNIVGCTKLKHINITTTDKFLSDVLNNENINLKSN